MNSRITSLCTVGLLFLLILGCASLRPKPFAKEAKLTDIRYLSDHREGEFGKSTGLLMDGLKLLARSVILVDTRGKVQYIQVVPEITQMPDLEKAFQEAIQLAREK